MKFLHLMSYGLTLLSLMSSSFAKEGGGRNIRWQYLTKKTPRTGHPSCDSLNTDDLDVFKGEAIREHFLLLKLFDEDKSEQNNVDSNVLSCLKQVYHNRKLRDKNSRNLNEPINFGVTGLHNRLRNKYNSRIAPQKVGDPTLGALGAGFFTLEDWQYTENATVMDLYEYLEPILNEVIKIEVDMATALDGAWVLISAIGIFAMQLGFSLLESGTVESKAVKSVLMKNLNDGMFGGCIWYLFGFGLYMGDNVIAGGDPKAFMPNDVDYLSGFFHQFGFSVTAVTIVSGAIVGRVRFESYLVFSTIFLSYVYPLAAHWCWSENAWVGDLGFIDFAGGGIIHGLGGAASFVGAYLCGPRVGRFHPMVEGQIRPLVRALKPNSVVLINLGGFILYINWFFFNCGSSLSISTKESFDAAAYAAANSLTASVFGACLATVYQTLFTNTKEVEKVINSLLASLVMITPGCASVSPFGAMWIGLLGCVAYFVVSDFILARLLIDDPLDASTIHGFCGLLGCICVGFFAREGGIFFGGDMELLKAQIIGVVVLGSWGAINALVLFLGITHTIGLTVSKEEQAVGLDLVHHDAAINELDSVQVQEYALRKDLENRMIQKRKKEREAAAKRTSNSQAETVIGKAKSKVFARKASKK